MISRVYIVTLIPLHVNNNTFILIFTHIHVIINTIKEVKLRFTTEVFIETKKEESLDDFHVML